MAAHRDSAPWSRGRARTPLLGAAAVVVLVGPFVLAFFSGGFFDQPRIVAAIVAWALVAVVAVVVAPAAPPRSGRPRRPARARAC